MNIDLLPIFSLLIVVLLEKQLKFADKYHPLTFAKLMAQGLAFKVHRRSPGSPIQQLTAGTLAPIVLLTPFILLLGVLIYLAEYPIFFDSVLLLTALRFSPIVVTVKKVETCLRSKKNTLAKQHLQSIVLRKTQQLSPFGITKTAIESLLLRFALQYCCVIILYLIGGGLLALSYRLLYEFSHCWNAKQGSYRYFGKPSRLILSIVQWIPVRIATLCFIIGQNISRGLGALHNNVPLTCSRYFLLNLQGAALGVELGGPVYYTESKSRLLKCGGKRAVVLADIHRATFAIRKAQWVFLVLCFIVSLLLNLKN